MPFTKAASITEIPPGKAKQVEVNGHKIALFHVGESFYAIDDTCTHRGGPLSEGAVEGTKVTCPWHGAQFDLTTGRHLTPPAPSDVNSYQVQVVGDEVQIDVT
jgi:nitrite reductase/ring-hydroxylating ferredoxin subunit